MTGQRIIREEEIWKAIKDFSNYEISNKGNIRRKERQTWHSGSKRTITLKERIMKQRWNRACKCYFLDLIDDDGKRRTFYTHKEVAKAFCINILPEKLTMVVHLDNNPKNNDSSNLDWVSPSEHMAFQFEVGNKDNFKVWKTRKKKYKNGFRNSVQVNASR